MKRHDYAAAIMAALKDKPHTNAELRVVAGCSYGTVLKAIWYLRKSEGWDKIYTLHKSKDRAKTQYVWKD